MKFQFLNGEHEANFQEMRTQMEEVYRFDKEYLAAAFIMAGDAELERKMKPYFDMQDGMFDSMRMFEEKDFSGGLIVLAKLAVHLFNNNEKVDPLDFMKLDDQGFKLAMNAISLRRSGISADYEVQNERIIL